MNRISLEQRGTAKWVDLSRGNMNRAQQAPATSVLEAVRFVMEQLPPDIRGSAWVEVDAGSPGIGDIQALYPTIGNCPRSRAVAERRSLGPNAGGDTSPWDAQGGAQVSER